MHNDFPEIMKACANNLISASSIILISALLFGACSGDVSYKEALEENREEIEDPKTRADANFLVEAKSLAILNTKIFTLASDSAYSSVLVEFARRHKEAQEEMESDLRKLGRDKDIKLPSEMSEEHRQEFDRSFIRISKRINEENEGLYSRNATGANDPDIRAFAARKLDQLEANLREVGKVEEQLLQTYDSSQP
jgi:hypothetical protein